MSSDTTNDERLQLPWQQGDSVVDQIGAAHQAQILQQQARNFDRLDAQVNHQYQKCNPDYQPPDEEDMASPVFINSGIMTSDQTLKDLFNSGDANGSGGGDEPNGGDRPSEPPVVPPPEPPAPVCNVPPASKLFSLRWWTDMLKTFLPLLATALLGLGIAWWLFSGGDGTSSGPSYDLVAIPFSPDPVPEY